MASLVLRKLDTIINRFTDLLGTSFYLNENNKQKEIKEFILEIVQFHDYGKVNPHFQKHINGNFSSEI